MTMNIACEKLMSERHHCLKRECEAWLKSCDEANATMKDFSKYHVIEEPSDAKEKKAFRKLVNEKERMLDELQDREYACRHALAIEIAFTASKEEFREMDLRKPSQVIGWAIKQGVSENPARRAAWAWFREANGVLVHWAGSTDFQLKRNQVRDDQIERLISMTNMLPI